MHLVKKALAVVSLGAFFTLIFLLSPQTVTKGAPQNFTNETIILNLVEPTGIQFLPDGRMIIINRYGSVRMVQAGATTLDATPVLTLTNINTDQGERGLVGITIDPNFASNGYIYLFYTANSPLRDRVSRFTVNGNTAALNTEVVIWQDTVEAQLWHHGGTIAFGPDSKLYISTGDGFDSPVSQNLASFRGKILRVNSDGTVPTDNPWAGDGNSSTLDHIWARGLRNPFRFSFDSLNGRMYIGDVGGNNQVSSIEEVNLGAAGANFGWPVCEGNCGTAGMTNPIFTYPHNNRDSSVTGGIVYRGGNFPSAYE